MNRRWFGYALRRIQFDPFGSGLLLLFITFSMLGYGIVESFKITVLDRIHAQSRIFAGADILVGARRPFSAEESKWIEKVAEEGHFKFARRTDFFSMAQFKTLARTQFVEVRALENAFPFFGEIITNPPDQYPLKLGGTLLETTVADSMGLSVGNSIELWGMPYKLQGTFNDLPFQSQRGAQIAPAMIIPLTPALRTRLTEFGVVASHFYALSGDPNSIKTIELLLKEKLGTDIRIQSHEKISERIFQTLRWTAAYLSLSSLIALTFCWLGIFFLIRSRSRERVFEWGILKFLGAPNSILSKTAVYEWAAITTAAVSLVFLIFSKITPLLIQFLSTFIQLGNVSTRAPWKALFITGLLGVGILVFLFVGLRQFLIKNNEYALFSEAQLHSTESRVKLPKSSIAALILFVLILAIYSVGNLKIVGSVFLICFIVFFAIQFLFKKNSALGPVSFPILMGLVLLLLPLRTKDLIQNEIETQTKGERPEFFAFDIQSSQIEAFREWVKLQGRSILASSPLMRGRLLEVNGESIEQRLKNNEKNRTFWTRSQSDEVESQTLTRIFNFTAKAAWNRSERIIEGIHTFNKFDPQKLDAEPTEIEVSLEEKYADTLHIQTGDEILFDVFDRNFLGKVVSIRRVDWLSFEPNFFVVTQPEPFVDAPKTWIAALSKSADATHQNSKFLFDLTQKFLNISTLPVQSALERAQSMAREILKANIWMAMLTSFAGFVVLFGILLEEFRVRQNEIALYQILSESHLQVVKYVLRPWLKPLTILWVISVFVTEFGTFGVGKSLFGIPYSLSMLGGLWIHVASYFTLIFAVGALCFFMAKKDPILLLRRAEGTI